MDVAFCGSSSHCTGTPDKSWPSEDVYLSICGESNLAVLGDQARFRITTTSADALLYALRNNDLYAGVAEGPTKSRRKWRDDGLIWLGDGKKESLLSGS
jgi:hypothetical protein